MIPPKVFCFYLWSRILDLDYVFFGYHIPFRPSSVYSMSLANAEAKSPFHRLSNVSLRGSTLLESFLHDASACTSCSDCSDAEAHVRATRRTATSSFSGSANLGDWRIHICADDMDRLLCILAFSHLCPLLRDNADQRSYAPITQQNNIQGFASIHGSPINVNFFVSEEPIMSCINDWVVSFDTEYGDTSAPSPSLPLPPQPMADRPDLHNR